MKRVLITGAHSYLGDKTREYLLKTGHFEVDILDMLDEKWRVCDFSRYDVVFNVCAIVHRFEKTDEKLYFQVNKDLAIEIAKKAKKESVKQFIQTSTVGVFGVELGEMSEKFGYHPKTPYERSKYAADIELDKLRDDSFKVCIIRPPIIYGKGCKGNFPKLEKFAIRFSIFPDRKNRRDMIYIKNMCDFVGFAISNELNENCYPRDKESVCVAKMVEKISKLNNKNIHLCKALNPIITLLYRFSHKLRSVFGDNYCTENVSSIDWTPPYDLNTALAEMYEVSK